MHNLKHMIKAFIVCALLLVFLMPSSAQDNVQGIPKAVEQALDKGINTPYWIEAENNPDISLSHFQDMKRMGINHVRLPVNPLFLIQDKERAYAMLDRAIKRINDAGMLAIVDFHPRTPFFKQYPQDSEDTQALIVSLWRILAHHLVRTTSPDKVALELYNEPKVPREQWIPIAQNLVKAVREIAPDHTLLIGGTALNSHAELYHMPVFEDPNIVYVYHYYYPSVFTRQGAPWSKGYKDISGLAFPPENNTQAQGIIQNLESKGYPKIARKVRGYVGHQDVEDHFLKVFGDIADWTKDNGVKVIMNEFGVVDTAPPEDRARWIKAVRTAAEQNDIGWSMWSYRGTYGLYQKDETGTEKLNPDIAAALGLDYESP